MHALVVGGDAKLGATLVKVLLDKEHIVSSTSRRPRIGGPPIYLDLRDLSEFDPNILAVDVVYLVAAITKVVDCEAYPQQSWLVNADAPVQLALLAMDQGARVVFISSDAVERAPNLLYSRQKAYAESVILPAGGVVVRPSRIPPDHVYALAQELEEIGRNMFFSGPIRSHLVRWSPSDD